MTTQRIPNRFDGIDLRSSLNRSFHQSMVDEAVNDALGAVRTITETRLQNIRLYADREVPNGKEIIALVDEITERLNHLQSNSK